MLIRHLHELVKDGIIDYVRCRALPSNTTSNPLTSRLMMRSLAPITIAISRFDNPFEMSGNTSRCLAFSLHARGLKQSRSRTFVLHEGIRRCILRHPDQYAAINPMPVSKLKDFRLPNCSTI
jgi:hypothetical protein